SGAQTPTFTDDRKPRRNDTRQGCQIEAPSAVKPRFHAGSKYMRKDARINIRLSTADLEMLKRRAAEEGLPYQSLIASVLHKYVRVSSHS
ncbi:MAG: CopG family antitoxin, partial [Bryobacteraceae bacterium]